MSNWNAKYRMLLSSPSVWVVLLFGFSSGLPTALTSGTLQAWLTTSGVNIKDIGLFSLVGLPYIWKFLWSPIMDRFVPPLLGRRRGWMVITQVGLIIGIILMAVQSPKLSPWTMAMVAFVVAFLSASQDISIDAYRTDLLKPDERGLGAAMTIGGWRLGILLSGGLSLIIAAHIGWRLTYLLMAGFMLIGLATSFVAPKPKFEKAAPATLKEAVVLPFQEFITRKGWILLLLFIVLYKFGDAFALSLISAFLIRGVGFDLATVGYVFKIFGVFAVLAGVFLGGFLMPRLKLYKSLLYFGIFQATTNLMFIWLAVAGKSMTLLIWAIVLENVSGGMGTAAFLAFIMALCDHRFTATQFALLSAVSQIGRVFLASISGYVVAATGWVTFYWISFFVAIPGLVLLVYLRNKVEFDKAHIT